MNLPGDQPIPDATAVVLAGGKSSRMGRPKSLLLFDGKPLIVHLVARFGTHVCRDRHRGRARAGIAASAGNLGAGRSSLSGTGGRHLLWLEGSQRKILFRDFLRCRVSEPVIDFPSASQISDYDVVVPLWQDRFQPLHAVYRTSVLPLLKEQLDRGELRPIFLFDKVRTRKIDEDEIKIFDPDGLSFFNMNTPDDYERALQRWGELHVSGSQTRDEPVSCTVELFGMARLLAKTKMVDLALPQQATLSDVFSELAEKLPTLVGRVITPEKNNLISGCACNVNGLDFVRNPTAKVKTGDRILILSADAGG